MSDKDMISKAFTSLKAPDDTLERTYEKMNEKNHNKGVFRHRRFRLVLTVLLVLALSTAGVYAAKAFRISKGFLPGDTSLPDTAETVEGFIITAPFAETNPFTHHEHNGIDFMAEEGTPVLAAADGQVVTAEFDTEKGNYIVIEHESGYSTVYAHLKELYVSAGDEVLQGAEIGTVGRTGLATGPHLHLELLRDGEAVNPEDYWETTED